MITIRKADERGHFDHGWLNTYHTFSFADYFDREFMGFRSLRVINEDRVQPAMGFGTHSHRDMEIISYVLDGGLAHRDSMGNSGVVRPGDVQRMSAGTGVMHSEFNASEKDGLHFLQIWIIPAERGIPPSYEQKSFDKPGGSGLRLLASPDGTEGSVRLQQDVRLYRIDLEGTEVQHELTDGRHAWVQVARGNATINGKPLNAGDGAAISEEEGLRFSGSGELLLFDLG